MPSRPLGGGWVADEALAIGVYCALVHEHNSRRALLLAANHGGDSDSTAAITGSILGAAHGLSCLPSEWITTNEATSVIRDMVAALPTGKKGEPPGARISTRPRPVPSGDGKPDRRKTNH